MRSVIIQTTLTKDRCTIWYYKFIIFLIAMLRQLKILMTYTHLTLPFFFDDVIIMLQILNTDGKIECELFDWNSYFDLIIESTLHITLCIAFDYIGKIIFASTMDVDYLLDKYALTIAKLQIIETTKQIDKLLNQQLQNIPGLKDEIWFYLVSYKDEFLYMMQQANILSIKRFKTIKTDMKKLTIENGDNRYRYHLKSQSIFSRRRKNYSNMKRFNFLYHRYKWSRKMVDSTMSFAGDILQAANGGYPLDMEQLFQFNRSSMEEGECDYDESDDFLAKIWMGLLFPFIVLCGYLACVLCFWLLCCVIFFVFMKVLPAIATPFLFYIFGMNKLNIDVQKQIVIRYTCSVFMREPICFVAVIAIYICVWFVRLFI